MDPETEVLLQEDTTTKINPKPRGYISKSLFKHKGHRIFCALVGLSLITYLGSITLFEYDYDSFIGPFISISTSTHFKTVTVTEKALRISDDEFDRFKTNETVGSEEQVCRIPKLNPFDESIEKYYTDSFSPVKCENEKHDLLFQLDFTPKLAVVENKARAENGWKGCCYKVISRANGSSDNKEAYSPKCYPLKNRTIIPPNHESLAVYCKKGNSSLKIVDTFAVAPLKKEVEARIAKLYKKSNTSAKNQVNVVLLGIDAVSHMNFQRVMPKVHKYLVKDLGAFGLDGFTKVGDNTFPNLMPILANVTSEESKDCLNNGYIDACPFIWKEYSNKGYRTSFIESSPWMGVFTYLKKGFRKSPVDDYKRAISRVAENSIGYEQRLNAKLCVGPRLFYEYLLNYMKSLAIRMGHDKRYFHLSWETSLTHDYLNYGKLGESLTLDFLKWFKKNDYLNNTVLIILSDHGIRWGGIRSTFQGKVEENMPFVYFLIPEWVKKKYPLAITNLAQNKPRLTTPFDLYQTLRDLMDLTQLENPVLKTRTKSLIVAEREGNLERGISLFLPVTKNRTCKTARIPEHFCVCHRSHSIHVNYTAVTQAANFAVYSLNKMVEKYPNCAFLTLQVVEYARIIEAQNMEKFGKNDKKTVEIGFRTMPGNASFDATLVRDKSMKWAVSGSISRTNLFGNQTYCIEDKEIKKYCFCIK